jgi:hypothetical protein
MMRKELLKQEAGTDIIHADKKKKKKKKEE